MYELRKMVGSLTVPLEEDNVTTITCKEKVLNLNIPSTELSGARRSCVICARFFAVYCC
jgi:hypothetical protein